MAFLVSRTDTNQFVLSDPATDTVIIDDDLAVGFAKLERIVADKPAKPGPSAPAAVGGDAPMSPGAAFSFRGGPRYTPVLLAVVLPFAWLAVLYLALANLLSEHALDRSSAGQTQTKIEALERDVQSLRSEISGAPRTSKQVPKRIPATKATQAAGTGEPGSEAPGADHAGDEDAGAPPPAPDRKGDDGAGEGGRTVEEPVEGIR
jgi:hypothetical protein